MILTLTTINKQMEQQDYSCWVSTLEYALDTASQITSKAYCLVKASLWEENGNRLSLPIDVFDGDSFSIPINQLKIEWQAVLSQPINRQSVHHQGLIELARQHMANFRSRILRLEIAIDQTNQEWCALEPLEMQDAYSSTGLRQYLNELAGYERQLARAKGHYGVAIDQLEQLQARC
jgi:hypothetical protein